MANEEVIEDEKVMNDGLMMSADEELALMEQRAEANWGYDESLTPEDWAEYAEHYVDDDNSTVCVAPPAKDSNGERHVYSAWELLNDDSVKPPKMLMGDILPAEGLALWTAREKTGKSFQLTDLLASLITGNDWCGQKVIEKQKRVVYLSLENGKASLKKRLGPNEMNMTKEEAVGFIPLWASPKEVMGLNEPGRGKMKGRSEYQIQMLEKIRGTYDVSVIAVDMSQQFLSSQIEDNNDYAHVYTSLSPIRRWAQDNGVLVIITHHGKKGNSGSSEMVIGSVAWRGAPSVCIEYMASPEQRKGAMNFQGTDIPKGKIYVAQDNFRWKAYTPNKTKDGGEMSDSVSDAMKQAKEGSYTSKDIREAIPTDSTITKVELMGLFCNDGDHRKLGAKTLDRRIKPQIEQGLIENVGTGNKAEYRRV